jgi:dihydrofolate reductase
MKLIYLIVAHNESGIIGIDNKLPWRLKSEMEHFVSQTTDNIVIMGRNTLESIPGKKLKNRHVIAISSQENESVEEGIDYTVRWATSLENALEKAMQLDGKRVFIAGGSSIYKYAIENKIPDYLIVSKVQCEVDTSNCQVIHKFDYDLSDYSVYSYEVKDGFNVYKYWKR